MKAEEFIKSKGSKISIHIDRREGVYIKHESVLELMRDFAKQTQSEEVERLRELLKAGRCAYPNCDQDGTIVYQTANGDWEPEPCEYCHNKKQALQETKVWQSEQLSCQCEIPNVDMQGICFKCNLKVGVRPAN